MIKTNFELFKDIKGYEGIYQVGTWGNVRQNLRSGKYKMLNPFIKKDKKNGYLYVILVKDGERKNARVHRLVAETFIPNPDNLPQVNHKDEDKTNNIVDNLEWCTSKYNNNYGNRNEKISKAVIGTHKENSSVVEFNSITEASKTLGINISSISNCCAGRTKSAGGYIWIYKE